MKEALNKAMFIFGQFIVYEVFPIVVLWILISNSYRFSYNINILLSCFEKDVSCLNDIILCVLTYCFLFPRINIFIYIQTGTVDNKMIIPLIILKITHGLCFFFTSCESLFKYSFHSSSRVSRYYMAVKNNVFFEKKNIYLL